MRRTSDLSTIEMAATGWIALATSMADLLIVVDPPAQSFGASCELRQGLAFKHYHSVMISKPAEQRAVARLPSCDVRFGSLADIAPALPNVRFTPVCGRLRVGKNFFHVAALVGAPVFGL
jgi:hypothetical protein